MRYLTLSEVLRLHADLVATSGGATGVRDLGRVQSALAQPMVTFSGDELYPTLVDKAAALGFALVPRLSLHGWRFACDPLPEAAELGRCS